MIKKIQTKDIILSFIVSILSVISLWGFWSDGIYALGINMTIISFLFLYLFLSRIKNLKSYIKNNLYWLIPMSFLFLSFSLYENPFLKKINVILVPLSLLFFIGVSITEFLGEVKNWNFKFILEIFKRKIPLLESINFITKYFNNESKHENYKKIIIGFFIFIVLNFFIVILLSSADKNFANLISSVFGTINFITFMKLFFIVVLFILIVSLNINWQKNYQVKNISDKKLLDPIISGIVLGGTLFTYILFIGVQVETIFTNELPFSIENVASFVKNGFWQLFFLSLINIILFFIFYKKTTPSIQHILFAFIIASIIILISAGNKMYLYAANFGFSYEKFYASYTVLYFGVLFTIMVFHLFIKDKVNILKLSIILAFSMYGVLNIIPNEQIIYNINNKVLESNSSENEVNESQKYQSHMLSIDILAPVNSLKGSPDYKGFYWDEWSEKKIEKYNKKKWYEKNINHFFINEK